MSQPRKRRTPSELAELANRLSIKAREHGDIDTAIDLLEISTTLISIDHYLTQQAQLAARVKRYIGV